jgi:glycosyltransferase domain-containing protein
MLSIKINNNILDKLTVCILTKDREKDLKKKILFYKKNKIRLIILDQSQCSIKKFCDINLNKNSYYLHSPNLSYLRRFILIKNFLKTKYCMLQTDDDIFFLNSMKKSLLFLEKNNDYVSVAGKVYALNIYKKNLFLEEIYKNARNIKFNNSFSRLEDMLNYSFFNIYYGVGRSKFFLKYITILKKNYSLYKDELHRYHELQYLIMLSLTGKIKILKNIFYLRVGYNKRLSLPMSSVDNLQITINSLNIGYIDPFIKNILKALKKNTVNNQKLLKSLINKEYSRRIKERALGLKSNNDNFIFGFVSKLFSLVRRSFVGFYFGIYGKNINSLPHSVKKEILKEVNIGKFFIK